MPVDSPFLTGTTASAELMEAKALIMRLAGPSGKPRHAVEHVCASYQNISVSGRDVINRQSPLGHFSDTPARMMSGAGSAVALTRPAETARNRGWMGARIVEVRAAHSGLLIEAKHVRAVATLSTDLAALSIRGRRQFSFPKSQSLQVSYYAG